VKFFDRLRHCEFSVSGGGLRQIQTDVQSVRNIRGLESVAGYLQRHPCDVEGCVSRAFIMFADKTHKAFCICISHIQEGKDEGLISESVELPATMPPPTKTSGVTKGAQR
jgi:hypothetical protein